MPHFNTTAPAELSGDDRTEWLHATRQEAEHELNYALDCMVEAAEQHAREMARLAEQVQGARDALAQIDAQGE